MKTQPTLLLASIAVGSLILTSCDEKEQFPIVPFYTIEIESGHEFAPDWAFATDEDGEPLDAKPLIVGGSVSLYGPIEPGSRFTLHFLYASNYGDRKYFSVESYADAPFNGTSHWARISIDNGLPEGPLVPDDTWASVHIENLPPPGQRWLQVSSVDGEIPAWIDYDQTSETIKFPVEATGNFLVSGLLDNAFYYALLEDVDPSAKRTVSLRPVDKPLAMNLGDYVSSKTIRLTGFYAGDNTNAVGYVNSEFSDNQRSMIPTMGYVDGFDQYRTFIFYAGVGFSPRTYVKLGAPIEVVPEFDNPEFVVDSEFLTEFKGTASIPCHMAEVYFRHESYYRSVYWKLTLKGNGDGAPMTFSMKSIPSPIRAAYPDFFIQNITATSATVTRCFDDLIYDDVLKNLNRDFTYQDHNRILPCNEYFTYELGISR